MKMHFQKQPREQGSALIITLTLGVILLVVMISYLMLLTTQKNLVTRSQAWNGSLTMAEAGIEEGLAQVNASASNAIFNFTSSTPTNNFAGNNWGGGAGNPYGPKSGVLLGGSYKAIIMTNSPPTIYATGYATVPIVGGTISRTIKITTVQESLINVGLGALGAIDFKGNGVATDSYNSHDTNFSTLGQYDPSKTSTNGSIASQDGLVSLGNHTINGDLYLGPTASYSGSGTIDGTVDNNYNVQFPDVGLPPGANGWTIASTTNISGTPTYDFTNTGNYKIITDHPIIIEAGVTVNLNVTSSSFSPASLIIHGRTVNSGTAYFYIW